LLLENMKNLNLLEIREFLIYAVPPNIKDVANIPGISIR
ncbi:MAG: hypothetical protein HeimC2_36780, partial [Candidatus Heimdallarchaeota archaeon LC_2]